MKRHAIRRKSLTYLLTNPGLDHIPRQVLGYLDAGTIVSCLKVSKAFKAFIENERHWYFLQSKLLREPRLPPRLVSNYSLSAKKNSRLVTHTYPQYVKVFEYFENEGDFEGLQELVWLIKDYTFTDDEDVVLLKYSPLFHAARFGCLKVLHFCLDNGFCFDAGAFKPFEGDSTSTVQVQYQESDHHKRRMSPLMMACKHAQTEAVRLILSYSETKEIGLGRRDDIQKTAFHWACLSGNLDIVKLLLSHMKDPKRTELSPIQVERRKNEREYRESIPSGTNADWTFSKYFGDTFVEPNKPDNAGMTGFHYACREGHSEIVQHLIKHTDSLDFGLQAVDVFKRTGLHLACKAGKIEIVKLLLNSTDVDLNARSHSGATPFMIACEENWIDIVAELLQQSNIDFNARDKLGRTAFFKACEQGHYQIVMLMYENSGRLFRRQFFAINGSPEEPKEEKIDIFVADDEGINALQVAREKEHERIVELLKSHHEYSMRH